MVIRPPQLSILSLTMLMPTPRPALSLSLSAVVTPRKKMRSNASSFDKESAISRLIAPVETDFSFNFAAEIPRPSSETERAMPFSFPSTWIRISPFSRFPISRRRSGVSIP